MIPVDHGARDSPIDAHSSKRPVALRDPDSNGEAQRRKRPVRASFSTALDSGSARSALFSIPLVADANADRTWWHVSANNMTETASFTQAAHFGQAPASSTSAASFPAKAPVPTCNNCGPSLSLHSHRQNNNSSKLPSFRYSDIKTGAAAASLFQQALVQKQTTSQRRLPPSSSPSVSAGSLSGAFPSSGPDAAAQELRRALTTATTTPTPTEPIAATRTTPSTATHRSLASSTSGQTDSRPRRNLRSRASSYQTQTVQPPIADQHPQVRRPASFPDSLVDGDAHSSALIRTVLTKQSNRRPPASRGADGAATSDDPPTSLNTQRRQAFESSSNAQFAPEPKPTQERTHGQRDLLLPKALSLPSPPDEIRASSSHRPPISYKLPANCAAVQSGTLKPVRVPPIGSFRSSGSRSKSLALDMNFQSHLYDMADNCTDSNCDDTLRATDGRYRSDSSYTTPPTSSRKRGPSDDDTGDVFLKIASEETARRKVGGNAPDDTRSASSRANRSSHRRPLSTTVTPYHPMSPPRAGRRLSDQQDRGRSERNDDDLTSEVARNTVHRSPIKEKAAFAHPSEDNSAENGGVALRSSPMAPRSFGHPEQSMENSLHGRRRQSVIDSSPGSAIRTPAHKPPAFVHGQSKTYNSSPLTRSFDFQSHNAPESGHAAEGTESTSSNTAPSTVWDELDDLKSRIHRLELTGKLPSTSGAAVIRASEERPVTATTTVTTMSLSPRKPVIGHHHIDVASATSSQREAHLHHPNLHSALAKAKEFLSLEVYRALETAASDALALTSIMGMPGQPGPISSAASATGTGPAVTDRQLRRRADSVCRSLTELCIALGECPVRIAVAQSGQPAQLHATSQNEGPTTPSTVTKSFNGLASSRRPSVAEPNVQMISPRAISKFEERRSMILNGSTLSSPRHSASTPSTPNEAMLDRMSSLVVARTRRAGTEEPEDGRRSSVLLRARRAGTEEPDEGRKTSLLVRGRRGTVGEEGDEARFRAPSRATTEVNATRGATREYYSDAQASRLDAASQPPVAFGRRRYNSSNLHSSRLAAPLGSVETPTRRYLERSAPASDGPSTADKLAEARISRHLSLSQHPLQGRNSSLHVRRTHRDSMTAPASSTTGAEAYR